MKKINIVGSIFGSDGYSSHTRQLANALYKVADCRITTQAPPDWVKHVNDAELDMLTKPERKDDYNLIIAMPHMWKLFTGLGKNIGYVIWEGDKVPRSWCEEFYNNKIDYIFVPSEHTKQAILNTIIPLNEHLKKLIIDKIKVIPHGVDRNIFHSLQDAVPTLKDDIHLKSERNRLGDTFKFICNKGWRGTSWDRGGVQYLIKAFAEEFKKDDKVKLIIKLNPAYINPEIINQALQQLNLPEDRAPIHINCDILPFEKLNDLYNQADCFVCPTRCESFNLPGLEAMSCGLPTIQTSFGGQTDYMTADNSMFIDYELQDSEEIPMYEGVKWAIPKMDFLKKSLRWAFENQDKIKEMGKQAEQDSKNFTWDNSAKKIIELL